jgi:hypothetical protein
MRETDERTGALLSFVDLGARVPARRLLLVIRSLVNEVLSLTAADFRRCTPVTGGRRSRRGGFCR